MTTALPPLRALWWTVTSLARARRDLKHGETRVDVPPPPYARERDSRWVRNAVYRLPFTCLAQSFVYQRWLQELGDPRDVVVGVTRPSDGFRAHAWVEGDPSADGFQELRRYPPVA